MLHGSFVPSQLGVWKHEETRRNTSNNVADTHVFQTDVRLILAQLPPLLLSLIPSLPLNSSWTTVAGYRDARPCGFVYTKYGRCTPLHVCVCVHSRHTDRHTHTHIHTPHTHTQYACIELQHMCVHSVTIRLLGTARHNQAPSYLRLAGPPPF